MPSLPQILLGRDWASRRSLRQALEHRRDLGGSLEVCLLETGSVSEERLLRALSELHGVPWAEVEALREAPAEVAALLGPRLAGRVRAVPFHLAGTAVHVAMEDPGDLAAQDEVAFACGKRIHVHVSHEGRIAEALDRFYGIEPSSRMAALVDKLNRSRYLWGDQDDGERRAGREADEGPELFESAGGLDVPELPDPASDLFPEPVASGRGKPAAESPGPPGEPTSGVSAEETGRRQELQRPQTRVRKPAPRSIQLSPEERRKLYGGRARREAAAETPAAGGEPEAPGAGGEMPSEPFAAAFQRLETARDRDRAGDALLDLLASQFRRFALLVLRGDRIEGWRGRGEGVRRDELRELSIPLDRPSVFLNLRQGSPFHLGPLPPFPAHQPLGRALGGMPEECLAVPVRLRGRLVLVLYGDRVDEALAGVPVHRFQELAERAGAAMERAILLKKQSTRGSDGG